MLQQAKTLDEALWTAVCALQERTVLLGMLSTRVRQPLRLYLVRQSIEVQARRLREPAATASATATPD